MGAVLLTYSEISFLLKYNAESGQLFWLERPVCFFEKEAHCNAWNARYAGKEAGYKLDKNGHYIIKIFGRDYMAHRVCWMLAHGEWPRNQIDHIDRVKSNNRLKNLRDVTNSQNSKNRLILKNNTSGFNGVTWSKRYHKWMAAIRVNGVSHTLGYFQNIHDAVAARRAANLKYGFSDSHGTPLSFVESLT